jgi:DNA mismatch repair ATPase MutS
MERFPHCLLLTRIGQFYEVRSYASLVAEPTRLLTILQSYFDQAPEIAKLLNIKHTSKAWGGQRVDMCGFPIVQLERHLKVLVQTHHRRVALCEEFKHPGGTFERRVTRIVTPGTLIDEAFLNPYENNYVLAISNPEKEDSPVGLAWMDVSTGEFFSQSCSLSALQDELVRIAPKEIVPDVSLEDQPHHPLRLAISEETTAFTSFISSSADSAIPSSPDEAPSTDGLMTDAAPAFNFTPAETSAISLLTSYLDSNLLEHMPVLSKPLRLGKESRMQLDSHTIKSLEIRESMREGGVTGSLLSVINRTVTSSGTRLLARWLSAPSVSPREINARQDVVGFFHVRPHLRADIILILRKIEDTARIVQKFLSGRGAPDDLANLRDAIDLWEELRKRMVLERDMEIMEHGTLGHDWGNVDALLNKMKPMQALCERITMAVDRPVTEEKTNDSISEGLEEDFFIASAAPLTQEQLLPTSLYKWSIKPGWLYLFCTRGPR